MGRVVEIDGKKIRDARLSLALSTDEFAELLGVTGRTIRNWEGGHTGIRLSRLRKIAEISGKPATWFYREALGGEPWPSREARYP
jgi:transcriptional regulator with XRE-family HTH domain